MGGFQGGRWRVRGAFGGDRTGAAPCRGISPAQVGADVEHWRNGPEAPGAKGNSQFRQSQWVRRKLAADWHGHQVFSPAPHALPVHLRRGHVTAYF